MSWNPGAEKAPLSFLLLGIVDGRVVIENNKQEERHTQHVGKDGELHVREHISVGFSSRHGLHTNWK